MTKAMEEARAIAEQAIDQCEGCGCDECQGNVQRIIATALAARDAENARLREALTEIANRYRNGANADTLVLIARKAHLALTAGGQP